MGMPMYAWIALAAALLGPAAAPARAADAAPRPGFDCQAARSPAERLICADAGLARLDAQAAALYAQARRQARDPDALRKEQLAWLRQRDAGCIAGADWAQVQGNAKARECLAAAYRARVSELRDRVAPPLMPSALVAVPPQALAKMGLAQAGCRALQGLFNERTDVLAVEVDCEEAGKGRRVWLLERGERVVPATPDLGPGDANSEAVIATGTDLYWDGDTLYVFTRMQAQKKSAGDEPYWAPRRFTATMANGPTEILTVPERVEMFHGLRVGSFLGDDPATLIADPDMVGDSPLLLGRRATPGRRDADGTQHASLRGTRAVWLHAIDGDHLALMVKDFEKSGAVTELARGGFDLGMRRYDNWNLVYPSMDGLLAHGLGTGLTRRIAGTAAADLPLAWAQAAEAHRLAWTSTRPCGGAQGAKGYYLCIASVNGLKQP